MSACVSRSQPIVRVSLDRTGPLISLPQVGTLSFPGSTVVEVRSSEPILTSVYEVRSAAGDVISAQGVRTSLYTDQVEISAQFLPGGLSTLYAAITDMVGNLSVATTRIEVIRAESHRLRMATSAASHLVMRSSLLHEVGMVAAGSGLGLVQRQSTHSVITHSSDRLLQIEMRAHDAQ